MTNLSFNVPDNVAGLFSKVCLDSKRVQEEVLGELLARYLEDIEDYTAIQESETGNFPTTPISALRSELGL